MVEIMGIWMICRAAAAKSDCDSDTRYYKIESLIRFQSMTVC